MITSYVRGVKPLEMALVTTLVRLLGCGLCKRMMRSILALLNVSNQRDIKMEVTRKHLEFSCVAWERAPQESVKGEGEAG